MEAAINEEIFADALDTCRTKQSAGSDGWQCILLRWAPRWLQEAYRQSLVQIVRERQYPPEWREWFVTMIPKAKRDPSLFKNLRDIWLVPHGWKIVTACFSAEYKRVNAETQPHAAHGFRQLRNAAQASLVVKLQTEEAAILCQPLVRMYFDLEGFFMGVVRAVLLELEKRIGVFPEVTEAMQALQGEAQGRIITAHGATRGFCVPDGTGQGCKIGPDRALLTLLPVISMMNRNVQGHRLLTRGAAGREGIRQTWFADDSTFYPIDPFMGQMCADVMDIYSWMSGNRVAVNPEATKSAFAAATCDAEEGLHSVADRYRMHFPREQEVLLPPVRGAYTTLGVEADEKVGGGNTRQRVANRCGMAIRLISSVGVADRLTLERYCDAITCGTVYYYGRTVPLSWADCEQIEVDRRKAYSRLGHRHRLAARVQVYAEGAHGGYGVIHLYAHAGAAVFDQVDLALSGELGEPDRLYVEAQIAMTGVRLGYVPSREAPTPLDWHPTHLDGHLRDEYYIEAWLQHKLRAGIRSRSWPQREDGWPLDRRLWKAPEDGGGCVVWERPGVVFSRGLVGLGLVRWVDMYHAKGWASWEVISDRLLVHTQGRSSSWENKIALEYKNLVGVTLRDAVAVRWLRAFSDKWHGEDPPRHVAPLQEEIDKYRQGYEIERIVDVRESGALNELEYLVQWKGFPLLGDTDRWEPERRLAEGLSPGEAAHLRDSLEQARARKREDGQPSVMPHGALAELRAHFGVQGWSDLRGGDIRAQGEQLEQVALILERRAVRAAFPRELAGQLETLRGGKYAAAAKRRLVPAPIGKTLFGGHLPVAMGEGACAPAPTVGMPLDPRERVWLEQTDSSPHTPAKREVDDDDREGHDDDAGTECPLESDCDGPCVDSGVEERRWPIEDDKRIPSLGTTEPKEDRRLRREAQRGLTVGTPPDHWTEAVRRARTCVGLGDPGAGPVWETEAMWRRDQPRGEPSLDSGCGLVPTDPVVRIFSRDVHLHPPGEDEGRLTLYKGLTAAEAGHFLQQGELRLKRSLQLLTRRVRRETGEFVGWGLEGTLFSKDPATALREADGGGKLVILSLIHI